MTAQRHYDLLVEQLDRSPERVIACSGGVDSLLLADIAHERAPETTIVAHSVSPAVPPLATQRVERIAVTLGWRLERVDSAEFHDDNYVANPVNRCYFCKTNLYRELERVASAARGRRWTVMSGANVDDLGEYRPGLIAAAEHDVRHPFVEAGLTKQDVRGLAAARGREWHDLPASPCLASRLYTGTTVTPALVRAVDRGEQTLRARTGLKVVRCRIKGSEVRVEVGPRDRHRVADALLREVLAAMQSEAAGLRDITLDESPYAPGRAFLGLPPESSAG